MTTSEKPYVAITMGDPAGIGAEVIVKALMDDSIYEKCRPFVIGNAKALEHAVEISGLTAPILAVHCFDELVGRRGVIEVLDTGNLDYSRIDPGKLSAAAGRAAVEWVARSGAAGLRGAVTGCCDRSDQQGIRKDGGARRDWPYGDIPKSNGVETGGNDAHG